jgi:MerR family transcriptional regulator/heat shock protein HspR
MMNRKRPLYMISVVAEILDIHPQTLRLYEREGFIKPERTAGNTRLYSDDDIEQVRTILHMTRDLGVNLAGVEVIMEMRRRMEELRRQNEELLESLRRELRHELRQIRQGSALVRVGRLPDPGEPAEGRG